MVEGRIATPGKLNVKTGLPLSQHIGFSAILIFSGIVFLRFSEYFPMILSFGITIQIRIHHHFLSIFQSFG